MEHSKTPWRIEPATKKDNWRIIASNGQVVSTFSGNMDMDNASLIVACVNACAGLDTALLENITMLGDTLKDRIDMLRNEANQRDELLAALEGLMEIHDNPAPFSGKTGEDRILMLERQAAKTHAAMSVARAVIQKVRGGE